MPIPGAMATSGFITGPWRDPRALAISAATEASRALLLAVAMAGEEACVKLGMGMSLSAMSIMHAGANSRSCDSGATFSKVTNGGVHTVEDGQLIIDWNPASSGPTTKLLIETMTRNSVALDLGKARARMLNG
jgi:hypothetical protein